MTRGKQEGGGRRRGEGILVGATQRLKAVATEVPACKGEQNRTKITLGLAESDHKSSLKSA